MIQTAWEERYNDEKYQRYHDPANRKHSFQSEYFYKGGRSGYNGGQNPATDPKWRVGITARLWYDGHATNEPSVWKERIMSARQTETKITALYERLSRDDESLGDSNSIINQEDICQGYFHPKNAMFPFPWYQRYSILPHIKAEDSTL